MSDKAHKNDATPMIKLGAVAVICLVLLILGSCTMLKCACGVGKEEYHYACPKPGCPGEKTMYDKKASPGECHGPMILKADKKNK